MAVSTSITVDRGETNDVGDAYDSERKKNQFEVSLSVDLHSSLNPHA